MDPQLRRLKELVQQGPADVIIGKRGLWEGVIEEIKRRLKEKGVVKVRALKSAIKVTGMDRKELAKTVAEKVGALLLDVRGRTFVLYLPPEKRERSSKEGTTVEVNTPPRSSAKAKRERTWSQRLKFQQTS
jgi:RNA-binding protein